MAGDRLHELAGGAWADGRECEGIKKGVPGGIVSTVRLIFCTRKGWKIFHPARRLYDVRRNQ